MAEGRPHARLRAGDDRRVDVVHEETGAFGAPELATDEKGRLVFERSAERLVEMVAWFRTRPRSAAPRPPRRAALLRAAVRVLSHGCRGTLRRARGGDDIRGGRPGGTRRRGPSIRVVPGARAAGPARTAVCGGNDNLAAHRVLDTVRAGRRRRARRHPKPWSAALVGRVARTPGEDAWCRGAARRRGRAGRRRARCARAARSGHAPCARRALRRTSRASCEVPVTVGECHDRAGRSSSSSTATAAVVVPRARGVRSVPRGGRGAPCRRARPGRERLASRRGRRSMRWGFAPPDLGCRCACVAPADVVLCRVLCCQIWQQRILRRRCSPPRFGFRDFRPGQETGRRGAARRPLRARGVPDRSRQEPLLPAAGAPARRGHRRRLAADRPDEGSDRRARRARESMPPGSTRASAPTRCATSRIASPPAA